MIYKQLLTDKQKEIDEIVHEMEKKKTIGLQQIRNQLLDNSTRYDSDDEEMMDLNKLLTPTKRLRDFQSVNKVKKIKNEKKIREKYEKKMSSRADLCN